MGAKSSKPKAEPAAKSTRQQATRAQPSQPSPAQPAPTAQPKTTPAQSQPPPQAAPPPRPTPEPSKPATHIVDNDDVEAFGLLLCGNGESGKTTFVRQLRMKFLGGFGEDERIKFAKTMKGNLVDSLYILNSWLEHNNKSVEPDSAEAMEHILATDPTDCVFSAELADDIKTLWNDSAIQEAYSHRNEIEIADHMGYFFDKIDELADDAYIPSDDDILRARIRSVGIEAITFELEGTFVRIFDVGGQRNERSKWTDCFQKCKGVIYMFSLADFCKPMFEEPEVLRIFDAIDLFQSTVENQRFASSPIFLVANKFDSFADLVKTSNSFKTTFTEYSGDPHDPDACLQYIFSKFMEDVEIRPQQPITKFHLSALNSNEVIQTVDGVARFIHQQY